MASTNKIMCLCEKQKSLASAMTLPTQQAGQNGSFTRIRIKDELNNEFKYSKVWRLTHVFTFLGTPRQHSPVCITIIGHDMLSSDLHSKGIVSVFSFIAFRFVYMPLADCIIYDSHHMYFCIKENKRFLVISLLNLLGLVFFICMFVLVSYRTKSPRYS